MSMVDEVHDEMDQVSGLICHAYTACRPRFAGKLDLTEGFVASYSEACEACSRRHAHPTSGDAPLGSFGRRLAGIVSFGVWTNSIQMIMDDQKASNCAT